MARRRVAGLCSLKAHSMDRHRPDRRGSGIDLPARSLGPQFTQHIDRDSKLLEVRPRILAAVIAKTLDSRVITDWNHRRPWMRKIRMSPIGRHILRKINRKTELSTP